MALPGEGTVVKIMKKPTRHQHTVWRKYLRAWAKKDQIWCGMAGGKRFPAGLMKVAQEKDFYRLREMTREDISLIHASFVAPMTNPMLRKLAEDWLVAFDSIRVIRELSAASGIDRANRVEISCVQAEEDLHGDIEQNAVPLLNRLLQANEFCLTDNQDYCAFMHFMMTQYFRTSRMVENLRRGMGERFPGTLERCMGVLRHMFASTAGFTLVAERESIKPFLLLNNSSVPLITGDQPVINLLAVELPPDVTVEDCQFYYPLSPQKAIVVTRTDTFASGEIDAPQAREFNRLIALSAERQIYAANMSDFDDVLALVGRHIQ